MKKLNWPTRDYTDAEIKAAHGDERNRMLIANGSRTVENISAIALTTVVLFIAAEIVYQVCTSF